MEDIYFYILIISFLVSFGCLLAVSLILSPPGTGELQHFNLSAFIINCTTGTCSMMQQSQNFTFSRSIHADCFRSSINPFSVIPLLSLTTLGNKMLLTHGLIVFLQSGTRDSYNHLYASSFVSPYLIFRD
jgi:hypothetical protein